MNWALMPVIDCYDLTAQAIADLLAQTLPVRVLVIDNGSLPENARRLDRLAEETVGEDGVPRVLVWHHTPPLPSLSATWNRALKFVWALGEDHALVVNNDVRLHKYTMYLLQWVLQRAGALFVSAVGVRPEQFNPNLDYSYEEITDEMQQRGGPDFSCFLLTREGHEKYPFDPRFPAYCEDLDAHRRYMLGGDGKRIFSVNVPFLHYASATINRSPEVRRAFAAVYDRCVGIYTQKWGGRINQERYRVPDDPASETDGVTTPELQRACWEAPEEP